MTEQKGRGMTYPKIVELDRVSLTVGEFTRRGVLWEHGAGMLATGALFLVDASRGSFAHSPTYDLVHGVPGGPFAWALWPLTSAALLLLGMTGRRWRWAVAGLSGLSIWYLAQTALVLVGWNKGHQAGLLGPVGVYGLVLAPKSVTHAVSVAVNGRRLDRE